jgi:hypothetical protein
MLAQEPPTRRERTLVGWKNGKRSVARQDATSLDSHKPLARSDALIIEELGDEVLVYDSNSDMAHCLSPDAARVWRLCDGQTLIDSLPAQADLSAERVVAALRELERIELLEQGPTLSADGHTRRDFGLRVAKVGVAAAAVPMIVSVAAPAPAMAASIAFCAQFSSGNCGTATGCTKDVGCCCCHTPIKPPYPTGEPCDVFGGGGASGQCKTCVPCDQDDTVCQQFGHPDDCSAGDAC